MRPLQSYRHLQGQDDSQSIAAAIALSGSATVWETYIHSFNNINTDYEGLRGKARPWRRRQLVWSQHWPGWAYHDQKSEQNELQ